MDEEKEVTLESINDLETAGVDVVAIGADGYGARLRETPQLVGEQEPPSTFEWASQRVRSEFAESTWDAFWNAAVEHKDVETICGETGLSRGAVYVAKSRVMACLREKIASVAGDWEVPVGL